MEMVTRPALAGFAPTALSASTVTAFAAAVIDCFGVRLYRDAASSSHRRSRWASSISSLHITSRSISQGSFVLCASTGMVFCAHRQQRLAGASWTNWRPLLPNP